MNNGCDYDLYSQLITYSVKHKFKVNKMNISVFHKESRERFNEVKRMLYYARQRLLFSQRRSNEAAKTDF